MTYLIYLALSIGLTVWVARTLHTNGRRFLLDTFQGDGELADSVNRLLVVGFYLINLGFVALALKLGHTVLDLTLSGLRPTVHYQAVPQIGRVSLFGTYLHRRLGPLPRGRQLPAKDMEGGDESQCVDEIGRVWQFVGHS